MPKVPSRPLPTTAVGLTENSWCEPNVLCLSNCFLPGSSWCGIHSMGDFSEAQPRGEVTLHQRDGPEGAWAFSEPRLCLCRQQLLQRLEQLEGKENRAKEKGTFQDSKRNRAFSPNKELCLTYLLTKISWKFKNLFKLLSNQMYTTFERPYPYLCKSAFFAICASHRLS